MKNETKSVEESDLFSNDQTGGDKIDKVQIIDSVER